MSYVLGDRFDADSIERSAGADRHEKIFEVVNAAERLLQDLDDSGDSKHSEDSDLAGQDYESVGRLRKALDSLRQIL
jgi:hypothetical protein